MKVAILPVKDRANAKQRLAGLLTAAQRQTLARVMFEEMLGKITAARGIDRVVVATSDLSAAEYARCAGVTVFDEQDQRGHSHSADRAARRAMEEGARSVLLLPIDVPLATTAEIEWLAQTARPGVIIVPSADGTGTNAMVRTPPDAIDSRFGKDSFRAHIEQARARGIHAEVMRPPGIVFDVDTPEDVAELLARAPECATASLLRALRTQWASGS
jgi:2-phospho-L-lactate guanylyltransferase